MNEIIIADCVAILHQCFRIFSAFNLDRIEWVQPDSLFFGGTRIQMIMEPTNEWNILSSSFFVFCPISKSNCYFFVFCWTKTIPFLPVDSFLENFRQEKQEQIPESELLFDCFWLWKEKKNKKAKKIFKHKNCLWMTMKWKQNPGIWKAEQN